MLTPKQIRALKALLTEPTKEQASKAAGISTRTMSTYLANPEFQQAYKKAFGELITDVTRQAQQSMSPAIVALREIIEDDKAMKKRGTNNRITACRTMLEYGLKLTEITDILAELDAIEGGDDVL